MSTIHILAHNSFHIHFNITLHLCLDHPSCLFPIRATCLVHFIFLDLIVLIISGKSRNYEAHFSSHTGMSLLVTQVLVFFLLSNLFRTHHRSSFSVTDQYPRQPKTMGKILVLISLRKTEVSLWEILEVAHCSVATASYCMIVTSLE
jgi:hypothetical protein